MTGAEVLENMIKRAPLSDRGISPVTTDESIVTDSYFVKDQKMFWNVYQLNMLKSRPA